MRRVLARLIPSPALGVALVALLLACGGLAYASTTGESVIRACANKKTGALRIASRCKRSERHVSWNSVGPSGRTGLRGATGPRGFSGGTGATGLQGPQGPAGPAGPGATTFATTVAEGGSATLATLSNGVVVSGTCTAGGPEVTLAASSGNATLQASGTSNELKGKASESVAAVDISGQPSHTFFTAGISAVDFDGLARDAASPSSKFAHLDVHGQSPGPCTFWGMVIPSS